MTFINSIANIIWRRYSNSWTISRKTYCGTWSITSSFSINITTYLNPSIIDIFIDPYMSTTSSIISIIFSTNSDCISISRETNWVTWMIAISFSINITTYLDPSTFAILNTISKNTYMSFIGAITTLIPSTNCNYITIRRETDWIPRKIKTRCPINIITYLCP